MIDGLPRQSRHAAHHPERKQLQDAGDGRKKKILERGFHNDAFAYPTGQYVPAERSQSGLFTSFRFVECTSS